VRWATPQIIKLLRFEMLEVPFIMRYRKGVLERGRIDGQRVWDVLEKVGFRGTVSPPA
jgi:transcriptional accessory protein Tex/SPT6